MGPGLRASRLTAVWIGASLVILTAVAGGSVPASGTEHHGGRPGEAMRSQGSSHAIRMVSGKATATASQLGTWSKGHLIDTRSTCDLTGVSCASNTFCMAVDRRGRAFEYSNGEWRAPEPIAVSQPLVTISCLNSVFCTAMDGSGSTYTYAAGAWNEAWIHQLGRGIVGADCTGATTCYAVSQAGLGYAYAVGGWGGYGALASSSNGLGGHNPFTSLSCVMAFCAAVDAGGAADTSGNEVNVSPSTRGLFGRTQLDKSGTPLTSVSCAFETDPFCVAVDGAEHAFAYTGYSWSAAEALPDGGRAERVSCTTTSFCLSVDNTGQTAVYWNGQWSRGPSIFLGKGTSAGGAISAISCATQDFCVALSSLGCAYTFTGFSPPWSPSADYKTGWNAFLRQNLEDVQLTCTWHEGTPSLDATRGCADAERQVAAERSVHGPTPTTFPSSSRRSVFGSAGRTRAGVGNSDRTGVPRRALAQPEQRSAGWRGPGPAAPG